MNKSITSTVILSIVLGFLLLPSTLMFAQNVSINANGALPDPSAILDISSTTSGLLIPRMTTVERDAIVAPSIGLQVFNLTTNTVDVYKSNGWESTAFTPPATNLVYVSSLSDLPAPVGSAILLNPAKTYIFSGFVDISPNYLNLNGAGLAGTDPSRDGVMSTVSGAILRSTDLGVFLEKFTVIPLSAGTKAYDFSDATGTMFCSLIAGCAVYDLGIPSLGVGQVSGFKGITFVNIFWSCKDGLKVAGNIGRLAVWLSYITGITSGAGIEFLAGSNINDVDLSNNNFSFVGQTGVKVIAGATISNGRLTTNLFPSVGTPLSGIDSYSFGWEMQQNSRIPNTRSVGYCYMSGNATATTFPAVGTFVKVLGTTTSISQKKFTVTNNRLTYTGKRDIGCKASVVLGATAPGAGSGYTIAIAKNGVVVPAPTSSLSPISNNQGFNIVLNIEVSLITNDYIEVFIKSNSGVLALTVSELQFDIKD